MKPNPPVSPPRQERPLLAIGLRLSAMALLSVMFTLAKLIGERGVNLVEMLFYRQLFAIPLVYGWILLTTGPTGIAVRQVSGHVLRAGVGLVSLGLNFASMLLLPLAEATTIGFTAPIFATVMSALILREATGIHRWSAVAIGFVGVLIMARPDTAHFPPLGLTVALLAAIGVAAISIILRSLSRTETPSAIVFWFSLLSVPPLGLLMIWYGQAHDPLTFALIIAMAAAGGIAQLLLTSALRWGAVAIVLPMDYSTIIWATLFGWLFWNALPIGSTWLGAALIIASGLYIVWREHQRGQIAKLKAQVAADIRA